MQMSKRINKNSLRCIGEEFPVSKIPLQINNPATGAAVYNNLNPSIAKDLVKEEIEWQKHRRKLEMMEAERLQRGQHFAMILTILCLAAAIWAVYVGYWIGIGMFFSPVLLRLVHRFQNPSAEQNSLLRSFFSKFSNRTVQKE